MKITSKEVMDKVSGSSQTFIKIDEGETKVRIVSPIYAVFEHPVEAEEYVRMIACPSKCQEMGKKIGEIKAEEKDLPCPLCEKGYEPKVAYLAFAVNRNPKKGEITAGVLKKGRQVFSAIQSLAEDPDWGPSKDYDVKIVAKGKGRSRKYEIFGVPANKSVALTEDEEKAVTDLAADVDLEKMTTPRPYEEIAEIIGKDFPEAPTEQVPF